MTIIDRIASPPLANSRVALDEFAIGRVDIETKAVSQYYVRAMLGVYFTCTEGDVEQASKMALQELNQVVYGDIEKLLRKLERRIYEGNRKECLDLIKQLYAECGK